MLKQGTEVEREINYTRNYAIHADEQRMKVRGKRREEVRQEKSTAASLLRACVCVRQGKERVWNKQKSRSKSERRRDEAERRTGSPSPYEL